MAKKTTVDLTGYAQDTKDRLAPIYGLRNILSAGLVLLDTLEPSDRERLISVVVEDGDSNSFADITNEIFSHEESM